MDAIPAVLCVFEKSQQIYKKEALFQTAYYSKASMIYSKLQHIFVRMQEKLLFEYLWSTQLSCLSLKTIKQGWKSNVSWKQCPGDSFYMKRPAEKASKALQLQDLYLHSQCVSFKFRVTELQILAFLKAFAEKKSLIIIEGCGLSSMSHLNSAMHYH